MKMLLLIFRNSLDQDIRHLLKGLDVKAFTEAPKVFGMGDAGHAVNSFHGPGFNSMILAAMEEDQAETVVKELRAFRNHRAQLQDGVKIPMRVFLLPCEQAI